MNRVLHTDRQKTIFAKRTSNLTKTSNLIKNNINLRHLSCLKLKALSQKDQNPTALKKKYFNRSGWYWLSVSLCTKKSPVWFLVRAQAQVVVSVPSCKHSFILMNCKLINNVGIQIFQVVLWFTSIWEGVNSPGNKFWFCETEYYPILQSVSLGNTSALSLAIETLLGGAPVEEKGKKESATWLVRGEVDLWGSLCQTNKGLWS